MITDADAGQVDSGGGPHAGRVRVRVLFFGAARDAAGTDETALTFDDDPARARAVFERVLEAYPLLRRFGPSLLFAVNQEYAPTPTRK